MARYSHSTHRSRGGRQRAVGEDQDGQPDQDDGDGPAGLGEHGHPSQRQRAVADPVAGDRVEAAVVAERPGDDQAEQAPAERVARLPPGHDEAHHPEGGEGPPLRAAGAGVHAQVRQAGERPLGGDQGQHEAAEHQRGGGRGQPEAARWPAGRGLARRRVPLPHTADGTPGTFRERYRWRRGQNAAAMRSSSGPEFGLVSSPGDRRRRASDRLRAAARSWWPAARSRPARPPPIPRSPRRLGRSGGPATRTVRGGRRA